MTLHKRAPRQEQAPAVVTLADGTRTVTTALAFTDRKQQLARKAAIQKRSERREQYAERHPRP